MSTNEEKKRRLNDQIHRRIAVLEAWVRDGLPDGVSPPKSLVAARNWDAGDLCIASIGSPGSFTTCHPVHGGAVKRIATLLAELKRKKSAESTNKTTPIAKKYHELKSAYRTLEGILVKTANQNQMLAAQLEIAQRDAALAQTLRDRIRSLEKGSDGDVHRGKVHRLVPTRKK